MERIKVVHLVDLDVNLEVCMEDYLSYLQEQGYDVSIICLPGHLLGSDIAAPDNTFANTDLLDPGTRVLGDLRTFVYLIRYFRREKFDIVHTHMFKPGLIGRLAAKIAGAPIIVHTVHGSYVHDAMPVWHTRLLVMCETLTTAWCHVILSQSEHNIETALHKRICPSEKISYLGGGIDLTRFYPGCVPQEKIVALRTTLGILPHQPVIGIIAPPVREMGIYEFIAAASMLKSRGISAKYLVVGTVQEDNREAISAEWLVREYWVEEDVMLLGPRSDIPELLSLMDIVVLPSYFEGITRVLMLSAAMGKPVVASRVGGNVEVVEDGETGVLVPTRNAPALTKGLLTLLCHPELAAEMGRQARQRALTHFDERRFFWRTDIEYRRLLKARLALDPSSMLKPVPTAELAPST